MSIKPTYEQKCNLTLSDEIINTTWINKFGKKVLVSGRGRLGLLRLTHESGRKTYKQDHYFAYEYDPYVPTGTGVNHE